MSLRLILGRAGSGKTSLCYTEIVESLNSGKDNPLVLLVPEQATFHNEIQLASAIPSGGLLRAQVLSFHRLGWRVLNEVGGASRISVNDLGRRMLLRGIVERRKRDLKVFGRSAEQAGFSDVLSSFLSELKLYRVRPGELSRAAAGLPPQWQARLCDRLADIDLVYSELEDHLRDKGIDPDDYMTLLADRVHLSPTMIGAEVWVDGFSGFTPQEYAVLEKIMVTAGRVNVTLCADANLLTTLPEEGHVFYGPAETGHRLLKIASKKGVGVDPAIVLKGAPRFKKSPSLEFVEKNYFNSSPPVFGGPMDLEIAAAAGPRAEVEAAARKIIDLCRDGGYRWRDMAVLVRDINMYHVLVSTVFKDYGIPFFIDHKGPVTHHPLVELIRSALEVAEEGWSYDPVIRFLKTGLTPVHGDEADILENYVLAHGIRGVAWTDRKDWKYRRTPLEGEEGAAGSRDETGRVNRARREGLQALAGFCSKVRAMEDAGAGAVSEALFAMLVDLNVPATLADWSARARAGGSLTAAGEHDRIWGQVVELLDQVVAAFGEDRLLFGKYRKVMESGLISLRLGLIPPGLDQVTVASLDRSRNPAIRAALLLGANDGIFPSRPPEDGILTDADREALAAGGISLAPGSRKKIFDEQFLVYTALTRSSERFYISYSLTDREGRGLLPSRIIGRLRQLLPALKEQVVAAEPPGLGEEDLEYVSCSGPALGFLSSRLRGYLSGKENHPLWWDVYNWYAGGGPEQEGFKMVREGLFRKNTGGEITAGTALSFYDAGLRASVSRIEKFNSCPFSHFLAYGLRLKERLHYKLTPPDMGEIFHLALRMFVERVAGESRDWASLDRDTAQGMACAIIDEIAPRLQNEILFSTARYRYMVTRLQRRLARAAATLAVHYGRGKFRPVGLEVSFGHGEGSLPPVRLDLSGGRRLDICGRIDRIDSCRWEKGNHLLVVDYKSGYKNIDLEEVYHGVNMQLPAYLDVAVANSRRLTGEEGLPGGIFYFTVADPVISEKGPLPPPEADKRILRKLRLKGLALADRDLLKLIDSGVETSPEVIPVKFRAGGGFYKNSPVLSEEQFGILSRHLHRLYKRTGEKIISGRADIDPLKIKSFSACKYCRYKPVCGFDPVLPENRPRIPQRLDCDQIWEKMLRAAEVQAGE